VPCSFQPVDDAFSTTFTHFCEIGGEEMSTPSDFDAKKFIAEHGLRRKLEEAVARCLRPKGLRTGKYVSSEELLDAQPKVELILIAACALFREQFAGTNYKNFLRILHNFPECLGEGMAKRFLDDFLADETFAREEVRDAVERCAQSMSQVFVYAVHGR
jgi:hypothetical protein